MSKEISFNNYCFSKGVPVHHKSQDDQIAHEQYLAAPYRQSIYCLGPAQKQRKMLRISGLVIAAHGMIFGENCTRFSYKLRELGEDYRFHVKRKHNSIS